MQQEFLSEEVQAAGYRSVDVGHIGGKAVFPGFGEIDLRALDVPACKQLVDSGFKHIVFDAPPPPADPKGKKEKGLPPVTAAATATAEANTAADTSTEADTEASTTAEATSTDNIATAD